MPVGCAQLCVAACVLLGLGVAALCLTGTLDAEALYGKASVLTLFVGTALFLLAVGALLVVALAVGAGWLLERRQR